MKEKRGRVEGGDAFGGSPIDRRSSSPDNIFGRLSTKSRPKVPTEYVEVPTDTRRGGGGGVGGLGVARGK